MNNITKVSLWLIISTCTFAIILTEALAEHADFTPVEQNKVEKAFVCREKGSGDTTSLLGKVQSAYSKISAMQAPFLQSSYLSAIDEAELSNGTIWFSAPGKMKWVYENPDRQSFLLLETEVWFHQVDDRQVVADTLDRVVLSELPAGFLMGISTLGDDFSVESNCTTSAGLLLQMKPLKKEKAGQLQELGLLISKDFLPIGAKIVDAAGNITSILFQKVKWDAPVNDAFFTPKIPDGTDFIDRRKE